MLNRTSSLPALPHPAGPVDNPQASQQKLPTRALTAPVATPAGAFGGALESRSRSGEGGSKLSTSSFAAGQRSGAPKSILRQPSTTFGAAGTVGEAAGSGRTTDLPSRIAAVAQRRDEALAEYNRLLGEQARMGPQGTAVATQLAKAGAEVGKLAAKLRLLNIKHENSLALQRALAEEDTALPASPQMRTRRPFSLMMERFPQPPAKPSGTAPPDLNKPLPLTPDAAADLSRQVEADAAQREATSAAVAREKEAISQGYKGPAAEARRLRSALEGNDGPWAAETRQVLSRLLDLKESIGTSKSDVREELVQIELQLKAVRRNPAQAIDVGELAGMVQVLRETVAELMVGNIMEGIEKTRAKLGRADANAGTSGAGGVESRAKAGEARAQLIDLEAKLERLLESELEQDAKVDA